MPTVITHPVVAIAMAPLFRRRDIPGSVLALGMACTVIPDLDVIGFPLGISYDHPIGHRGLSHSPFFAVLWAAVVTLILRWSRRGVDVAVFLYLFLCTVSHGVLDALTDGGLGIAFLAPLSNERYFFPWRPIKVAPISVSGFLSWQGLHVLRSELQWVVLPCLAFASIIRFIPRRT